MSESTHPEVAILNAALELPPEARTAYLEKACAGDTALRTRIEALIEAHERAGGFLESSPSHSLGPTPGVSARLTEKPGDRIGHYKLLQQIGEGGCGVVYMAEQEEPVRRRVALKIIKLGMDTQQVVARFEAERQTLALMDHSHIAKVLDAGATETGRPYFVMELVRGIRINEFCDTHRLSTRERLELFIPVCRAIQHAHQKGIIHRDIKPSNILVTVNDGEPIPKVIDFGIAKATQGRLTDQTLFTAFEQFMGTPAYMSPEQAVMTSVDVDTRSDIYSLGVLLYELLTGSPPFDEKDLLAAGLEAMRRTIQEKDPPRPSTRLSTLAADALEARADYRDTEPPKLIHLLRGDLDWIVMKCLEKDRKRRYETANGLAMDLLRHLANDPVIARPPTATYRLQKLVQRNKLAVIASLAVLASLLIGLVISTWMFVRERDSRQLADQAASRSEQVARFLQEMLEGVGPSKALGRDTTMLRDILDRTAERIGEELQGQPEVEAELLTTLGQVYEAIGEYEKAEEMHRRALELLQSHLGVENPQTARSMNALAMALRHQEGKLEQAETFQRDALAMQQRLFPYDHPDIAQSLNDLAIILQTSGDALALSDAEAMQQESIAMLRRLGPSDHEQEAKALNNLAATFADQGRWNEAVSKQQEALELQEELLAPDHPDIAQSLNNLSVFLRNLGDLARAEEAARRALALRKTILEPNHPHIATSCNNLASVLWREMQLDEAEERQREAIRIQVAATSPTHPESLKYRDNLGTILRDQGKFAEAEVVHREVLAVRTNEADAVSVPVAFSLNNLAQALADQGRYAAAEQLHHRVLAIFAEVMPHENPYIPTALVNLAIAQQGQERFDEAEANHLRALDVRLQMFGPDDWTVAQSRIGLGRLYRDAGRLEQAETNLLQALSICNKLPVHHELLLASCLENLVLLKLQQNASTNTVKWADQCLEIYERRLTNTWKMASARATKGQALLASGQSPEAEALLLSGCRGLRAQLDRMPASSEIRYRMAIAALIQLYRETSRLEEAMEWQQELEKLEARR